MFGNVTALEGLHVTGEYRALRPGILTMGLWLNTWRRRQCGPRSRGATSDMFPASL